MAFKSKIKVKESIVELKKIYHSTKDYKVRLKVKSIILFKENKLWKQEKIATHLCISHATFNRWLKEYDESGISGLIHIKTKGKPKTVFDTEIKLALQKRVDDVLI